MRTHTRAERKAGRMAVSRLPEDMQVLLQDYFGAVGMDLPETLPLVQIDTHRLPAVGFEGMGSDSRGKPYAEAMIGRHVPPVVIADGFLLDGRHRLWAARQEGLSWIWALTLTGHGVAAANGINLGPIDPE